VKFFLKFNFARLLYGISTKKVHNNFYSSMHTIKYTDDYNFIFFANVNGINLFDYIYKEWLRYEKKHLLMKTIRYD
jgi:hypothetical protein